MKSVKSFSQFITEEAEGITPEQKKKLDDAEKAFAAKAAAELAATSQVSTSPAPASNPAVPVRTVATVTDYNAAIGRFDELPLEDKTMDITAAKAWLILTRDKLKKQTEYTTGIKILKDNFPKAEPFAQKMLAIHFKYPVEFLKQQSTTSTGSKYTGVTLQGDQYTLGAAGQSANYSIGFTEG